MASPWKRRCSMSMNSMKTCWASATTFTMPSKAVTVTANWTKSSGGNGGGGGNVRYTVSFETNGGNDIASKTVTKNSVIKEPESLK